MINLPKKLSGHLELLIYTQYIHTDIPSPGGAGLPHEPNDEQLDHEC